jgi:hypothetical protein
VEANMPSVERLMVRQLGSVPEPESGKGNADVNVRPVELSGFTVGHLLRRFLWRVQ